MATFKKTEKGFQDQLWLNAGQKYCRMLQEILTFIKLPFVIKIFVLSIFEWFYCIVPWGVSLRNIFIMIICVVC